MRPSFQPLTCHSTFRAASSRHYLLSLTQHPIHARPSDTQPHGDYRRPDACGLQSCDLGSLSPCGRHTARIAAFALGLEDTHPLVARVASRSAPAPMIAVFEVDHPFDDYPHLNLVGARAEPFNPEFLVRDRPTIAAFRGDAAAQLQ